ncbi:alpha/beta fold hydrolase [Sphingomonas mali]|uniref:alpha/beta fold hydrolase n=1 Tax=Sphingomonas mali TaxID=40682 RepID=UPI000836E7C6|nr:alpha/beta hydrolase [Sphingomonas mali]
MTLPPVEHHGFASRTIDADGLRTHFLDGGTGPTLILIHGGGAGADGWGNWRSCLDAYARDFRVLVPDMPGFGRTAKPDPAAYEYTQQNRTRHLLAFMDTLGVDRAHLIGNSMGGATALGVAMAEPHRVDKLVLMGSAGLAIANPDPSYMKNLTGYDYTVEGMRRIVSALTAPGFEIDEKAVHYRHALMQDTAARVALKAIVTQKLTYDRDAIAAVKTPTLVVGGKDDQVAVLARTYGYLELLENSWGFILPHVGHWAMIEAPGEFLAVTSAFLDAGQFRA